MADAAAPGDEPRSAQVGKLDNEFYKHIVLFGFFNKLFQIIYQKNIKEYYIVKYLSYRES
jgi:hypothetical protein